VKFENSEFINTHGTNFKGKLEDISYERLVETFGEPTFGNMDKISCEWCLEFECGTVATIYDWETPFKKPIHNRLWNVGGFSYKAHELVKETLDSSPMRMDELPQHEQDEYNQYLDDTAFSSTGYPHED